MARILIALSAALGLAATGASAQHTHKPAAPASAACATTDFKCATTVTPVVAPDGTLWVAWAAGGAVSVARSIDLGKTFSSGVAVHAGTLPLDNGPDARPKIVIDAAGAIIVTYATRDDKYNGAAFVTRSTDGGKTFAPPSPITSGSPSQRFETAGLAPDGRLFAVWIDKRNAAKARSEGVKYAGAALAFSTAGKGSTEFPPATIARDNTCECCRIALAFTPDGRPAVVFRNIFDGGVRDHALITFSDLATPGPVMRVSDDAWATDACPHHGPSIAITPDGSYHVTWFTSGKTRKGVFYARSLDGGKSFTEPLALGTAGRQISRPYVLATREKLLLVWKEFDGERTEVRAMTSGDGGKSFGAASTVAATSNESDHPMLVAAGGKVYLSWQTKSEGYRLIAVEPQS